MSVLTRHRSLLKNDYRQFLFMMSGQAVSLGFLLASYFIIAHALFIAELGSDRLAWAYILGALVSLGGSNFFQSVQEEWSVNRLTYSMLGLMGVVPILGWGLIWLGLGTTALYLVMMWVPLFLQLVNRLIYVQSYHLLRPPYQESLYARMLYGVMVGIMLGSFLAPFLRDYTDQAADLLLPIVALPALAGIFWWGLKRVRPDLLDSMQKPAYTIGSVRPLRRLLEKPFIGLVFNYQLLSIATGYLLEFIILSVAAQQYGDVNDFLRFLGTYNGMLYLAVILFLMFGASYLLQRFGLLYSLVANAMGTSILLLLIVLNRNGGMTQSGLVLVLFVVVRMVNQGLMIGSTQTAVDDAYQTLPPHERNSLEQHFAVVGRPLALLIVGLVLWLLPSVENGSVTLIVLLTLLVAVASAGAGLRVYQMYSQNLLRDISHRHLSPTNLELREDQASLDVIARLVRSSELREVKLALDVLESANHASFANHLIRLAEHELVEIRLEALARIENHRIMGAITAVRENLAEPLTPGIKGRAIRTLCALLEADAVDTMLPYLDDNNEEIQAGAMIGLLRYGGIMGIIAAGEQVRWLARSADPHDRRFVAEVIAQVGNRSFYQPLINLLHDRDVSVRQAALAATEDIQHPRLLPMVIANLSNNRTRSAALNALIANDQAGNTVLPLVTQALTGKTPTSEKDIIRLVRVCGQIGGDEVISLLKQFMAHQNRDIRYHILAALHTCGYRHQERELPEPMTLVQGEVAYGLQLLVTMADLGTHEALDPLLNALTDAIDRTRLRIFFLLSYVYGSRAMLQAGEQIVYGNHTAQELATQMLEITLPAEDKAMVLPFVDPDLSPSERRYHLGKLFDVPHMSREERLRDLIINDKNKWNDSWLQACAIYAVGHVPIPGLVHLVSLVVDSPDPVVRETVASVLLTLDPSQYQMEINRLGVDKNKQVAKVVKRLSKTAV
ncbi:MAG TPA: HEAT repeat domain-containing protein [Anaerolineae bacterium]|nr:HEAT repeat domain-containing protein [Anaerolineae bacterium]